MRISFIIWIVAGCLFVLSPIFSYFEYKSTSEIWNFEFDPIGEKLLNVGESHSFEFTFLRENELLLRVAVEPPDEILTVLIFSQDGELIRERSVSGSSVLSYMPHHSQYEDLVHGGIYKGSIINENDIPVYFEASLSATEPPPKPTDYEYLDTIARMMNNFALPLVFLGGIVFAIELKHKRQKSQSVQKNNA